MLFYFPLVILPILLLIATIADNRGHTRKLQILAQNGQLAQERFDALTGRGQRRALSIALAIALALLAALIAYAVVIHL
jgi:hypothetical protein